MVVFSLVVDKHGHGDQREHRDDGLSVQHIMEALNPIVDTGIKCRPRKAYKGREDAGSPIKGTEHASLLLLAARVTDGLDERRPLDHVGGNGEQRPDEQCHRIRCMYGENRIEGSHHRQRGDQKLLRRSAVGQHSAGYVQQHPHAGEDGHKQAELIVGGLCSFTDDIVKFNMHIRERH